MGDCIDLTDDAPAKAPSHSSTMSIKDLKAALTTHGVDIKPLIEKAELVAAHEQALKRGVQVAVSGQTRPREPDNKGNDAKRSKPAPGGSGAPSGGGGGGGGGAHIFGGIKPKHHMADGEDVMMPASKGPDWKISRRSDTYHCSCPAWRNQRGGGVTRTCKHLKEYLGEAFEAARVRPPGGCDAGGLEPGDFFSPTKGKGKGKGKASADSPGATPEKDSELGKRITKMVALANSWDKQDPTGMLMSEKLDGMRAVWDGEGLYSRTGKPVSAPPSFFEQLPPGFALDGELFLGRKRFQDVMSVCRTLNGSAESWREVRYKVFEAPGEKEPSLAKRMDIARQVLAEHADNQGIEAGGFVELVEHTVCRGREHVKEELDKVEALGGEGVMLAKPDKLCSGGRSDNLLKVKSAQTTEALVVGHQAGKGKNVGVMGALECKLRSGKKFKIGTGFTDKQRADPPPVGSVVEFKYFELTRDEVPRFPAYQRIRPDVGADQFTKGK